MELNQGKLNEFLGRAVVDFGATLHAGLVVIGEKLGLYKALASADGPLTPAELAQNDGHHRALRARVAQRAGRRWLRDLRPRYRTLLALAGAGLRAGRTKTARRICPVPSRLAAATLKAEPKITEAFRSGAGFGWHEHDPVCSRAPSGSSVRTTSATSCRHGSPRSRASTRSCKAGAKVADVGCGHGASTILMAQAFPKSRFVGFDYHGPSIEAAATPPTKAGVTDRVTLRACGSQGLPGRGLRSRRVLRLPARHGRPGRRRRRTCCTRSRRTARG